MSPRAARGASSAHKLTNSSTDDRLTPDDAKQLGVSLLVALRRLRDDPYPQVRQMACQLADELASLVPRRPLSTATPPPTPPTSTCSPDAVAGAARRFHSNSERALCHATIEQPKPQLARGSSLGAAAFGLTNLNVTSGSA
eukprot:4227281-Pleurochrysis_carterae.AAC.1